MTFHSPSADTNLEEQNAIQPRLVSRKSQQFSANQTICMKLLLQRMNDTMHYMDIRCRFYDRGFMLAF
jgi:hypothetical protein